MTPEDAELQRVLSFLLRQQHKYAANDVASAVVLELRRALKRDDHRAASLADGSATEVRTGSGPASL